MAFVAPNEDAPVELSIVIISYNTKDLTLQALESLFRHPPPVNFEVLLLDNASLDGSFAAIDARFPQIQAIAHPTNVGFAAGNNIAAERARGRRILLLNPDTITLENSHAGLWAFAEAEPGRGIWGGRTLFPDMTLNPTSCWRRMTLWSLTCSAFGLTHWGHRSSLFNPEAMPEWKRDSIRDVDIVTGCFLLIDTALWRRLGGFDPAFFMYAEEADLCLRAAEIGANPGISPAAEIVHMGGVSEATGVDKIVKTVRGRVTLMKKHWNPLAVALGRGLLLMWSGLRLVGSRFVSGRRDAPGTAQEKWRLVWSRRREWLAGYDARPAQ
ncbi:glycosyltransferase family 2 protein [Phenylobacterium kunshanense]|uniref:Glycosyltransferase family 2 protein n=1 Tax=Phenylobacterium kunshanense TaxID=1445034 RepID=A0A328BH12_9CAUL|nr:glycosyltransferase family 2 protein [Phenylobacterium kunshanense]RAK66540.1 glycosyltransferase family 2 protein [Phenylobacterium kunshanense]